MTNEQKRKKVDMTENERYVIDVEHWDASYAFRPNNVSTKLTQSGGDKESATITLIGKIISPTLENVLQAKVEIAGCPNPDEQEKQEKTDDDSLQVIGSIVVLKDNILSMHCSLPHQLVQYILVSAVAEQIKYAVVWGTSLKEGKGEILGIDLATGPEDL